MGYCFLSKDAEALPSSSSRTAIRARSLRIRRCAKGDCTATRSSRRPTVFEGWGTGVGFC
eukprot:12260595-Alexandrium_andersonii.AAC.1